MNHGSEDPGPDSPTVGNANRIATGGGLFLWVLLYVGISGLWYGLWRGHPHLSDENGVMEDFQVGCILAGVLFLVWGILKSEQRPRKILLLGLAVLYFTLATLEVDTRKLDVPSWVVVLTNGLWRNLWVACLWLAAAVIFLRRARETVLYFFSWLRTGPGMMMLGAMFFWLASFASEKLLHLGFFAEEILECNAALLMLHSAWKSSRSAGGALTGRSGVKV